MTPRRCIQRVQTNHILMFLVPSHRQSGLGVPGSGDGIFCALLSWVVTHVPYWLLKRYLPPGLTLTSQEYWNIQNQLLDPGGYNRREWQRMIGGTVVIIVICCAAALGPAWLLAPILGWTWSTAAGLLATVLVCLAYTHWSMRRIYVPRLVRALREVGYEVCGGCNHWLKGLPADIPRCPECGAARHLATAHTPHP